MSIKRELIYIDGKEETDRVVSYSMHGDKYVIVFENNNTEYTYNRSRIKIVETALSNDKAYDIFAYLKKIAEAVGLKPEEGANILAKSYQQISFIPENCILANYLNGKNFPTYNNKQIIDIFPFGFNISQKEAVNKAFTHSVNIIEGPPGTGKTQTILNIIANAVMNGKCVAVVSSNNSATKNIYEKLEKNDIGFIAALLGNSQNKKEFIDEQPNIPDLSKYKLSDKEKARIKKDASSLFNQLAESLSKKNELALLKQNLDNIRTEYQYFKNTYKGKINIIEKYKPSISADKLIDIWLFIENQAKKRNKLSFINKLILRIKYRIKNKLFNAHSFEEMIFLCQSEYYPAMIFELTEKEKALETSLNIFSFDHKMKEYTDFSMLLLKSELYEKYNNNRVGSERLFRSLSSHTTVRTVRYTAVS